MKKLTKPRAKPTQKAKAKAKAKVKVKVKVKVSEPGALGHVVAVHASGTTYLPARVFVLLDGDPKRGALNVTGWSLSAGAPWPIDRLAERLTRIHREWAEEFGDEGLVVWKLQIDRLAEV